MFTLFYMLRLYAGIEAGEVVVEYIAPQLTISRLHPRSQTISRKHAQTQSIARQHAKTIEVTSE